MNQGPHSVVLVYSTSHAIRLEKLLQVQQIPCRLIPVPRHLSSDCGVCVRFDDEHRDDVGRIVTESGMEIQEIAAAT